MNITQTQTGWLANENNHIFTYKTIINQNTHTTKHIIKKNNKTTKVYTLTLEKDSLTFTKWDNYTLQKKSKFRLTPYNEKLSRWEQISLAHLTWAIHVLRNQPFEKKEYYDIHDELFGIPNLIGEINYSSPLAQALYRKPGIETLSTLLFRKVVPFIREKYWLKWDDLETIHNCHWENKEEIIKKIGLEYGRYMNLFSNPEQFTNTIQKTNYYLIKKYLDKKLPPIPSKLNTTEEIKNYIETQIQQHNQTLSKNFENIKTILGDPIKVKSKIEENYIKLQTDKIKIYIKQLSPFPLLKIEGEITSETEILICEELGIRSRNYIPSRLKKDQQ